ncbi:proheparin-binding EGF-like growth factor isoform X3 [Pipistrellus kuhlii]|uniref:proheparin-binding EGF-like growth factor isoform X3 n=1 Tax=Pipistrellus kuhlii TaxID=59472 RepID=UPI001E2731CC|nr:proheparin-binding EGF-like growth factor isoform X3 [Pipistrellus kuhlii]
MEDFKEKLLGLASLLMEPGTWSPLFLALGFHVPSCCSSGYLGAHWNRQGVWAPFSSKPQALATPSKEERGKRKKKGKGLGKKRDPCLKKYKDYCIHGECKYVKELRAPSCICNLGYHGERCHGLSLPVENRLSTYDHTTILAVVAVVLSSVCLLVIVGLLMFRNKLGTATSEKTEADHRLCRGEGLHNQP